MKAVRVLFKSRGPNRMDLSSSPGKGPWLLAEVSAKGSWNMKGKNYKHMPNIANM